MRVLGDESYHKEIHRREIEGTQVGALSQRTHGAVARPTGGLFIIKRKRKKIL